MRRSPQWLRRLPKQKRRNRSLQGAAFRQFGPIACLGAKDPGPFLHLTPKLRISIRLDGVRLEIVEV
jgi:hypothetical protein